MDLYPIRLRGPKPPPEGFSKPVANQGLGVHGGGRDSAGKGQNETTRSAFFCAPGSIAGAGYVTRDLLEAARSMRLKLAA